MKPYTELPGLAAIFLEESYVLDIEAHPSSLVFVLDAVLTPDHPEYEDPPANEQYCFSQAELRFTGVQRLVWTNQGAPPATDANDERDYGNIDSFEWDEAGFDLEGAWGRIEAIAGDVELVLRK